jgi:hypothetical protein
MPLICYRPKDFNPAHQDKINKANTIITEYKAEGYELTLRQVFYQFVSRGFISNAIIDHTRELDALPHWKNPADIIEDCASQFRIDKWADQPRRVEIWIEKDAMETIVKPICQELDVPFFSCRSQSTMWQAAMRLKRYIENDQKPLVLHFGDHDPSGIDMTRDIRARLEEFSEGNIDLRRIALNRDQIEQYGPPPNPAKITDSRSTKYIAEHGGESWELDALEPRVITALVRDTVNMVLDKKKWKIATIKQQEHRDQLQAVSDKWTDIIETL